MEPMEAMVCRTCHQPLTYGHVRGIDGEGFWLHPDPLDTSHEPDPVPEREMRVEGRICFFCSSPKPQWKYFTAEPIAFTIFQNKYGNSWAVNGIAEATPPSAIDIGLAIGQDDLAPISGMTIRNDTWLACRDCAKIIEKGSLSRLVRRGQEITPRKRAHTQPQVMRKLFGAVFTVGIKREPIRQWP